MTWEACPSCGHPLDDESETCPQCDARVERGTDVRADKEDPGEAGIVSPYGASTDVEGEEGTRWEHYEIPWFDVPLGFRAIAHPRELRLRDRRETVNKYGARSLVLSLVALALGLTMLFAYSLLPAVLGVFWGLVAQRLAKKGDRRGPAVAGFIVGGWVCFNWVMTLLINA